MAVGSLSKKPCSSEEGALITYLPSGFFDNLLDEFDTDGTLDTASLLQVQKAAADKVDEIAVQAFAQSFQDMANEEVGAYESQQEVTHVAPKTATKDEIITSNKRRQDRNQFTISQIAFVEANVTESDAKKQMFWGEFLFKNKDRFPNVTSKQIRELWDVRLTPSLSHRRLTQKDKSDILRLYFKALEQADYVKQKIPKGTLNQIGKDLDLQSNQVRGVIFSHKSQIHATIQANLNPSK